MNVYLPFTPRLPSEYQEVEWIGSSGTQWIDTLVTPTQNTKSQIKVSFDEYTGYVVYGYFKGDDNNDYRFFNAYARTNHEVFDLGRTSFDFGSQRITGNVGYFQLNTIYELELGNYYLKNIATGTNLVSGSTISSFTGASTITLNNHNNTYYSKNKWYYVKIYNGSTLVRDFVPCYRKSDSVIGLYDLVNNQFYTNSGTGTFSKGNDVIMSELKNDYIGEYVSTKYYVDFRGSNQSAIENLGWTFVPASGGVTFSSEGMHDTTNSGRTYIYRAIDLTNSSSIHIEAIGKLVNGGGQRDGVLEFIITDDINSYSTHGAGFGITGWNNSLKGAMILYNGEIRYSGSFLPEGDYNIIADIDLTTGSIIGTTSGASSLTMSGTISSTYLNYIKTSGNYLLFMIDTKFPIIKTMSFEIN